MRPLRPGPLASGGSSRGDPFAPPEPRRAGRAWSPSECGDRGGAHDSRERHTPSSQPSCTKPGVSAAGGPGRNRPAVALKGRGFGGGGVYGCGANWVSACIPVGTARPGRAHEEPLLSLCRFPAPSSPQPGSPPGPGARRLPARVSGGQLPLGPNGVRGPPWLHKVFLSKGLGGRSEAPL